MIYIGPEDQLESLDVVEDTALGGEGSVDNSIEILDEELDEGD